jgi:Ca2+-binding EF-hand superfamily protein
LDTGEFATFLLAINPDVSPDQCRVVFEFVDNNKDGKITLVEFKNHFQTTKNDELIKFVVELEWASTIFAEINNNLSKRMIMPAIYFENPDYELSIPKHTWEKGLSGFGSVSLDPRSSTIHKLREKLDLKGKIHWNLFLACLTKYSGTAGTKIGERGLTLRIEILKFFGYSPKKIAEMLDMNKNGSISKYEFRTSIRRVLNREDNWTDREIDNMFEGIDIRQDKSLRPEAIERHFDDLKASQQKAQVKPILDWLIKHYTTLLPAIQQDDQRSSGRQSG